MFSVDAPTPLDLDMAKQTGDLLEKTYPGHGWRVFARGGVVYFNSISICQIDPNAGYSMVLHQNDLRDAGRMAKKVRRAGGEYLERARLRRQEWHGETAEVLQK